MQVVIEEIVSRVRATSSEAALSSKALGAVVSAVMEAIEADGVRAARREEELSSRNHHQRNPTSR